MPNDDRSLVVSVQPGSEQYLPQAIMSLDDYKSRLALFREFVNTQLRKGTDYGVIPHTDKPTLFQPGAQKLCEMYGLAPIPRISRLIEDWEKGFFCYDATVSLVMKSSGVTVAEGIGSCNSKEDRYAWRWAYEKDIPTHLDKTTLRHKEFPGKNGGTYQKWRIPNDDLFSLVNTIQKMAVKRALIAATLMATRSSGIFTQDTEDLPSDYIEGQARIIDDDRERRGSNRQPARTRSTPTQPTTPGPVKCHDCGNLIEDGQVNGRDWERGNLIRETIKRFKHPKCATCLQNWLDIHTDAQRSIPDENAETTG